MARDRDVDGRARNARARDALGRPLPRGESGIPRLTEGQVRSPEETIELAQRLLDSGRPFHAHEVFEDAWKSHPKEQGDSAALWKGYAQLAVGLTHAARENPAGAVSLLRRGAATLVRFRGSEPYGLRVDATCTWSVELADRIERDGLPEQPITAPPLR